MTLVPHTNVVEDPGEPYLFFDVFPFDVGPRPAFDVPDRTDVDGDGDSDYRGGILKATDGVAYGYVDWFVENYQRLIATFGDNRGRSSLAGGYHYVQFGQKAVPQMDFYFRALERAGWRAGVDIMPILDVEFGGDRMANHSASNQQIVDTVSGCAELARLRTGRGVMLYGRGVMRDRGIASKMGCTCVWNPSYTSTMSTNGLVTLDFHNRRPGAWTLDDIVLWQHVGDGQSAFKKLPSTIPDFGHGKVDQSVFVDGERKPTLARMLERLT